MFMAMTSTRVQLSWSHFFCRSTNHIRRLSRTSLRSETRRRGSRNHWRLARILVANLADRRLGSKGRSPRRVGIPIGHGVEKGRPKKLWQRKQLLVFCIVKCMSLRSFNLIYCLDLTLSELRRFLDPMLAEVDKVGRFSPREVTAVVSSSCGPSNFVRSRVRVRLELVPTSRQIPTRLWLRS